MSRESSNVSRGESPHLRLPASNRSDDYYDDDDDYYDEDDYDEGGAGGRSRALDMDAATKAGKKKGGKGGGASAGAGQQGQQGQQKGGKPAAGGGQQQQQQQQQGQGTKGQAGSKPVAASAAASTAGKPVAAGGSGAGAAGSGHASGSSSAAPSPGAHAHPRVPGSPLLSALHAGAHVQAAAEAGVDLSHIPPGSFSLFSGGVSPGTPRLGAINRAPSGGATPGTGPLGALGSLSMLRGVEGASASGSGGSGVFVHSSRVLYSQPGPEGSSSAGAPAVEGAVAGRTGAAPSPEVALLGDEVKISALQLQASAAGSHSGAGGASAPASSGAAAAAGASSSSASSFAAAAAVTSASSSTSGLTRRKAEAVEEEKSAHAGKPHLNMVVVGHVDSGKSTLVGHLLLKRGRVSERTIRQFAHESRQSGKASFHFAWVLDQSEQERTRGVTVDVGLNWFETPERRITVLDCPGHRDFIPNMISGAAQADVGILTISAAPGEFEAGFMDNGQTREHAILTHSLGVRELIVAVNKLDVAEPAWSKDRFDAILESLLPFLELTGFDPAKVYPVPISGFTGENLEKVEAPELKAWYDGPSLLDLVNRFAEPPRALDRPFRMVVSDAFSSQTQGFCISGKVDSGVVLPRERLLLAPMMLPVTVKSIENNGRAAKAASAGENVELGIKDVDDSQVMTGQILCDPAHPVPLVTRIEAQIVAHQSRKRVPLLPGVSLVLHTQSSSEAAAITRIVALLAQDGTVLPKKTSRFVPSGSNALVEITLAPGKRLCMETYADYRDLGRFSLRKDDETVAVGIVTAVLATAPIAGHHGHHPH